MKGQALQPRVVVNVMDGLCRCEIGQEGEVSQSIHKCSNTDFFLQLLEIKAERIILEQTESLRIIHPKTK